MTGCNQCGYAELRLERGSHGLFSLTCTYTNGAATSLCDAFCLRVMPIQDPRGPQYGESYRAHCEARSVCRLLLHGRKDEHLAAVRKKRGEAAAVALEDAAREQWRKRRDWMAEHELKRAEWLFPSTRKSG